MKELEIALIFQKAADTPNATKQANTSAIFQNHSGLSGVIGAINGWMDAKSLSSNPQGMLKTTIIENNLIPLYYKEFLMLLDSSLMTSWCCCCGSLTPLKDSVKTWLSRVIMDFSRLLRRHALPRVNS
ncbi:uncharacterized protein LOC110118563 [Ceratitis capitata]|uniref:uncharacterized protein LOC110118563 n=1 Tax=Ceratitis capitata TaxID=7213 RepID=UPI000A0F6412|nr:uncharacterized protein LOC110118563 [Ceratitis capitata]